MRELKELKQLKKLPLEERAKLVLEKQYNNYHLRQAENTQNLLELHVTGDLTSKGYATFENFFQSLLPPSKHDRFTSLLGDKLATAEICENMFTELKKVFGAQNKRINYGLDEESEAALQKNKKLNPEYFITNQLWERLQYSPNDILLIKTDEETGMPYPEFIDLSTVLDACADENGKLHYFLYKYAEETLDIKGQPQIKHCYYYIDWEGVVTITEVHEESIDPTTQTKRVTKNVSIEGMQEHGYDYCPAIFVYPRINNPKTNSLLVNSPLLKVIHRLDWLAFFIPSKKYFDSYATFPIITKFEDKEDFDSEQGDQKVGDYFVDDALDQVSMGATVSPRTRNTKSSNIVGAGSIIEVPTPDGETLPNILEAVKFISADPQSLKYVSEQEEKLIEQVFYSVVGKGAEFISKFSASAEQLENSYDSRKQILSEIREVIERVFKFYAKTVLTTYYGDKFDSDRMVIFLGDTYYLMTPQQVVLQYDKLVKSGVPESLKLDQLKTLIHTTYANSPKQLFRGLVLLNAEPHPTHSLDTVVKMAQSGSVQPEKAFIKINFNDLVEEYELSFGDIGSGEGATTISKSVTILNEYFKTKYVEAGSPTFKVEQTQPNLQQDNNNNN
jgi:hypothetical protein